MSDLQIYNFDQLYRVDRSRSYIGIHLSGLFGDTIHASTRFQYIKELYPDTPWLVIHSYPRIKTYSTRITECARELLSELFNDGRIAYYFADYHGHGGERWESIREICSAYRFCRIPTNMIFECLYSAPRFTKMTLPDLGISIPQQKTMKKAVIFRRSAWHNHFPQRNRPVNEWLEIEQNLYDKGYTVFLFGLEDKMPTSPFVKDYRGKLGVRDILKLSKDASLCITVATFLYQWTQHICPTFVLSAAADCHALNTDWKLNDNLVVVNVEQQEYLRNLKKQIPDSILREIVISPTEKIMNGNRFIKKDGIWRLKLRGAYA